MRIRYPLKQARIEKLSIWHRWFAWYPVQIPEEKCWVWLETIQRRLYYTSREVGFQTFSGYDWKYKTIELTHGDMY